MGGLKLWGAALLGTLALACGSSSDHPANLDGGLGNGGSGGGGGGSTSTGGTTSCDPKPGQGVTLSGNLIVYDIFFKQDPPSAFTGQGIILAEGAPCGVTQTTYDGTAPGADGGPNRFLLPSVQKGVSTWVRFYEDQSSNVGVYSTMLLVSTADDLVLDDAFGFINAADVQKVYTDTNTTPLPDRGTIVVQLIDGFSKLPAAGGKVATTADAIAAYPQGAGWALDTGGTLSTDASGVMVLMNVESVPFPGSSTAVNVTAGGITDSHPLVVETGTVTIARIVVGFQT
jgi:hypothetical protein